MSEYKMNQYELQSYFKSLCNSFYIAYDQVKRLEREIGILEKEFKKFELEMENILLEIETSGSSKNKKYKYLESEIVKEIYEYKRRIRSLKEIKEYWSCYMNVDMNGIKCVIDTINDNEFSVIVTTKQEVYALMCFYLEHSVEEYPIVNMKKEYRESFPTGEEIYEDFIEAYYFDYWADAKGVEDGAMKELYEKYF